MTAETDLLPLRDWMECLGEINAEDIRDYARANVAHATAAKDAEIEALRAEVGETREVAVRAMRQRDAQYNRAERLAEEVEALRAQLDEQCRLHAIGMERELALITERDRLRVELGCLQQQYDERTACMIVHRGSALACSDAVRAAYYDEHERAERLAEALETCLEVEERPSIIEMARVALRDHDQEGE